MPYQYDNKEFSSLKALARYAGINEKTLTARIRRGMSLEDACRKTDLRCTYFIGDDGEKSVTEICNDNDKGYWLVQNRLKYGYNMKDALNTPKKVTKQGAAVIVEVILYNSLSGAIRKYNQEEKEQKIRRRIKKGRDPTEVFQEMQLR